MPSESMPFGPDAVMVPAYLASDESDPDYLRWLQDHPDAFVAGTWTGGPPPAQRTRPPTPGEPRPFDPTVMLPTAALLDRVASVRAGVSGGLCGSPPWFIGADRRQGSLRSFDAKHDR